MMLRSWIRRLFDRHLPALPVNRTIRKVPCRSRLKLAALEDRCVPSTIVVNNATDTAVVGEIDLRQAIAMANTNGGNETITFNSTVFNTAHTITLTGGQLELSDTTGTETITGPKSGVTVSGGGLSRVFQIDDGVTASISGLTISGGYAYYGGGGVNNAGSLTMTSCTVSGNSVTGPYYSGGGVSNTGSLTMTNCIVSGSSAASAVAACTATTAHWQWPTAPSATTRPPIAPSPMAEGSPALAR